MPYIWNICAEYYWGIFHIYLNGSITYAIILYYLIWNAILKVSPRKLPAHQNEGNVHCFVCDL